MFCLYENKAETGTFLHHITIINHSAFLNSSTIGCLQHMSMIWARVIHQFFRSHERRRLPCLDFEFVVVEHPRTGPQFFMIDKFLPVSSNLQKAEQNNTT